MAIRRILKESACLLLAAAVLALATNWFRPDGLPLLEPFSPLRVDPAEDGIQAISLEAARERFASGSAVFVDARPPSAYGEGHISGSWNVPDADFDAAVGPFFEAVDPSTFVITYCDGANCHLSHSLAEKLVAIGYTHVAYLPDGWRLWKEGGLPVASGEGPTGNTGG